MQNEYLWEREPKAENLVENFLIKMGQTNSYIPFFESDLLNTCSSRLFDWVDHLVISKIDENALLDCGFVPESAGPNYRLFSHPGAQLPKLVLSENGENGVAIKVESIADFLLANGKNRTIEGAQYSGYRKCCITTEEETSFWVIERRGTKTMEPTYPEEEHILRYLSSLEKWKGRNRRASMEQTITLAEDIVDSVGRNPAAWIILEVERLYWQGRNTAAQIQKSRQDRLGLGWANHDHHTFRSSRENFHYLVRLFEILGFHCRERFYAGDEAGWGAQVMENSSCGLVLFLDVDLNPEELSVDFAHHPLKKLDHLGTIGLWCALHGDSIREAGMHHLEAQFLFEELKADLDHRGIRMMDPFSDFPYLKQAFTAGEIWQVNPGRVQRLVSHNLISKEDGDKFLQYGAVGSHLENLQRREGFKGFNQKNVSYIIKKTDPRTLS